MLIVGEKEEADRVVSLRNQSEGDKGQMTPAEFVKFVTDRGAAETEPIKND
jgi:threonyl-tRNA synthetase